MFSLKPTASVQRTEELPLAVWEALLPVTVLPAQTKAGG